LRLARTILLARSEWGSQRADNLKLVEQHFRKSIELHPDNPQAWGELLRFLFQHARKADQMFGDLDQFLGRADIDELDRSFLVAQLMTELNLRSPASRFWSKCIQLTEPVSVAAPVRQRILLAAAAFFAQSDLEYAVTLARTANLRDPDQRESLQLLTVLLSDLNTPASLKEASDLLAQLLPELVPPRILSDALRPSSICDAYRNSWVSSRQRRI
jgi:tetratricopeptide (TPR) repeat protein